MSTNKRQKGFVALMSVLIISAILLVIIYLLSASSFVDRFDALDTDFKRSGLGAAEACAQAGILDYAQGITAQSVVTADPGPPAKKCIVCSVNLANGTILVRSLYNHAYTNIKVVVDTSYNVTNWQEAANYSTLGGPACTPP